MPAVITGAKKMRRVMLGIFSFICCVGALFIAGQITVQARSRSHSTADQVARVSADNQPTSGLLASVGVDKSTVIRSTRLISIPYGFDTPLPLDVTRQQVRAAGEGACTAGETVTVAVTISQTSTGANAVGEQVLTCTGQVQRWWAITTVPSGPALELGTAEACGVATTRQNGAVTDTFDWCREVVLNTEVYLPLVVGP